MSDFPRSLLEFQNRFPAEAACAAYLREARWPGGFVCPACGKQTSVTAGTVMHGSKLPLTVWVWAAYLMATHSNAISALQIQKQLGIGSSKTAWLLCVCAKLRRAMVAPNREPLAGLVEVDEAELPCRSKHDPPASGGGRSHQGKILLAGAVEVQGDRLGRIRLFVIRDFSAKSLHAFLKRSVAPGATVKTNGWSGYPGAADVTHNLHLVGPRLPMSSCPGSIASSRT